MPKTPHFTPSAPMWVEILAFPKAQLLDIAGPLQVFASANGVVQARGGVPPYRPVVVAAEPIVTTSAGLGLVPEPLSNVSLPLDTLLVSGGVGVYRACEQTQLIAWISARAAAARRAASVCTGAFLLAEAGLLDGRRAVTHWHHCGEFAARYPAVRLEPDPIFLQDGKIWTSAGVTAGIDLTLALVEADLGRAVALAVARDLVVFLKRPGGQSQFSASLALQAAGSADFDDLHTHIAENLRGDLSVAGLAQVVGMSERSFVRHYRQATGSTPARGVERIRVEAARRMLELNQPVKRVAARCGFGSEETMRRSFLRLLGATPQAIGSDFANSQGGLPLLPWSPGKLRGILMTDSMAPLQRAVELAPQDAAEIFDGSLSLHTVYATRNPQSSLNPASPDAILAPMSDLARKVIAHLAGPAAEITVVLRNGSGFPFRPSAETRAFLARIDGRSSNAEIASSLGVALDTVELVVPTLLHWVTARTRQGSAFLPLPDRNRLTFPLLHSEPSALPV